MKVIVALLLVAAATADKLRNNYLPPLSAHSAGGSGSFLTTPLRSGAPAAHFGGSNFRSFSSSFGPAFPQAPAVHHAPVQTYSSSSYRSSGPVIPILRLNNDNNGDGNYRYDYETANHISAQESGHVTGADSSEVQGSFSYQSPEGQNVALSYVADENGFRPVGDHIPTPPPVPQEILESLRQNAAEEARGVVDDGSYHDSGSSSSAFGISRNYGAPSVHQAGRISGHFSAPRINNQYLAPAAHDNGGYRY